MAGTVRAGIIIISIVVVIVVIVVVVVIIFVVVVVLLLSLWKYMAVFREVLSHVEGT